MRKITKLFQTKAASIDEDAKTVTFIISDDQPDRMGEIVDQTSWNFKDYLKNPVFLWGHDPSEPENVLGTGLSLDVAKDGSNTAATVQFDTDINPKAALTFEQVKRGSLRTVSVGFINHTFEMDEDIPVLKDNDLLEISLVPIPANPRAVALAYKAGEISRKDANWLMDGMRKEADFLEKELESTKNDKDEHGMDADTQKLIGTLLEAVTALTESQTATNERLDKLSDALQAQADSSDAPTASGDDDEPAPADPQPPTEPATPPAAPASDEPTPPANDPAETPNEPAKGGDDDQPGAGADDELDENAELTPELQAQIDSALEADEPTN